MSKYNIKEHTCAICNKNFGGRKKKYCSKECADEVRRIQNRENWRKNNPPKPDVTIECEWCGKEHTVPARTAHQARFCNSKCKDTWWSREVHGHKPIEEHLVDRRKQAEANKELAEREKVTKKIVKSLALAIKHKEEQEKIEALTRECEECGDVFYNPHPINKTCSPRCSKRRSNRMMKLYASKRINEHNLVDKGISLRKLYKRDKGVCYLCGYMCDKKDVSITDEGYYIVGPAYPSVDHVEPLSKGGKHAWNNVKLAHHYCNTLKGDSQR